MNIYLFNLIHNLSTYSFVNNFSIFVSYTFVYIISIVLIAWILFYQNKKIFSFSILTATAFVTWVISELVKSLTAIARPVILNPIIIEKGFSFPSQHSAIMMALAVSVFSLNKKFGIFLFVMAFFVGISRIILGVHFPVDVIVGWVLGGIIGFIFVKLFKNI